MNFKKCEILIDGKWCESKLEDIKKGTRFRLHLEHETNRVMIMDTALSFPFTDKDKTRIITVNGGVTINNLH